MSQTAAIIIALIFLAGCGGIPKTPPAYQPNPGLVVVPVNEAKEGTAAAEAYIDAAEGAAQQLLAIMKTTGDRIAEVLLNAVSQNHAKAKEKQQDVKAQLAAALVQKAQADNQARQAVEDRDGAIAEWTARDAAREAKWYVVWGRRIETWVKWILIGWAALGVLSIVFGMANPLSLLGKASAEIVHFIPFGNIFPWIESGFKAVVGWFKKKPPGTP